MSVMNIKEKIGQRILEARKEKGLTRKALAELTDDLQQSRINNWERGIRTPGPQEIKQLAEALDVSPAFLMCLSDNKFSKTAKSPSQLIPLLNHQQACDARIYLEDLHKQNGAGEVVLIPISTVLQPNLSKFAFALKMADDSMTPEIRINDIQIIDPTVAPKPGDYVVVKISGKPEVITCQYRKLSYIESEFELITLNDNWPNIKTNDGVEAEIIGVLMQNVRVYS